MKQILLFSLDLLLDTRLAMLSRIDSAIADSIIVDKEKGKQYRSRLNDQFTEFGLMPNIFDHHYKRRKADLLPISRPTRYLFELAHIGYQLIKKATVEPHNVEDIEFHINMYPYTDLTEEERIMITAAIKARVQDSILVKCVDYSPSQLTPAMIRSAKYTGVFMYDLPEWVNLHYGENVNPSDIIPIPSVSIYSPLLFNNPEKLKEAMEFKNANGESCNPILGFRGMWSPYFFFEGIDIGALSIVSEDDFIDLEIVNK